MYNILFCDSIHSSKRLQNRQSVGECIRNTLAKVNVIQFQHCCINELVTTVQQYWASETVNCFLEAGMVNILPLIQHISNRCLLFLELIKKKNSCVATLL